MFKLRQYQQEAVDKAIEYFNDDTKGGALIVAPTACHKKGHKILMYDGSLKNVEDIILGDFIMGNDSKKRTVINVHSGKDIMYKIIPKRGEEFIVNGNHILYLINNSKKNRYKHNKKIEISVNEYIKLPKSVKHSLKLLKSDLVLFKESKLSLDPYFLGIMLGDGSLGYSSIGITTSYKKIVDYCYKIAKKYGCYIRISHKKNNKAASYYFTYKNSTCSIPNPLTEEFKKIGLKHCKCEDKFIPEVYKINSKNNRLKLLAGLLDTDGHLDENLKSYEYVTKSKRLADDIIFLCRSLGFHSTVTKKYIKKYNYPFYRIYISGNNLHEIPCKIKNINKKLEIKNNINRIGFDVEKIGIGKYYGFELKESPLFISGDFFITHNSGKSIYIASIAKELKGNTIVFQPNKEILEQNYEKMCMYGYGDDVSIFSASLNQKEIGKITLATIGSAINKKELFEEFDNIIVDEAHMMNPKEGMYKNFIDHVGAKKVLGLTATPFRMHSYSDFNTGHLSVVAKMITRTRPRIFNRIIHITQIDEMYKRNFLCPIKYVKNPNYDQSEIKLNTTGRDFVESSLMEYNEKIKLIDTVKLSIKNLNLKHILVFCVFVHEAEALRDKLNEIGIKAETVSAKTPKKERKKIIEDFKSGKIKVVTNVGTLTTGFDFPELDGVILARPTKSISLYMQMVGRAMRMHESKESAIVVDICNNNENFGDVRQFKFIETKKDLHRLVSDTGPLTGYDFYNSEDLEKKNYAGKKETTGLWSNDIVPFGKHQGTHVTKLPNDYLKWTIKNFDNGPWKTKFEEELLRRNKKNNGISKI